MMSSPCAGLTIGASVIMRIRRPMGVAVFANRLWSTQDAFSAAYAVRAAPERQPPLDAPQSARWTPEMAGAIEDLAGLVVASSLAMPSATALALRLFTALDLTNSFFVADERAADL
eukprot:CAMPEP_0169245096 /NCGR_PEP_ID=MMETSP1016-20121227/34005_1 /TAXON_ID=342587 /ORGANISM="Karlodinium micrum, Strain CCMP2283" /LENGTH=115 /DNA_ID=CAMNT_0009325559 /DNA_START=94 /DNA_END=437 /DNA_ORIENTATION=-